MIELNRGKFESNAEYFFHLYNDLGFTELELQVAKKAGDIIYRDKWRLYEDLMHLSGNDVLKVFGRLITRDLYFDMVNNRRVLDIELVLDIDVGICPGCSSEIGKLSCSTCNYNLNADEFKNAVYVKVVNILHILDQFNSTYEVYDSGGKGFHIHILIPKLREYTSKQRLAIKRTLIKTLGADVMKAFERNMILLEYSTNPKTGKIKTLMEVRK